MTEEMSFEDAYQRLEEILEKMQSGKANLEQALSLYEEADQLIKICSSRLQKAEARIQKIAKNQHGEEIFTDEGELEMTDFSSTQL